MVERRRDMADTAVRSCPELPKDTQFRYDEMVSCHTVNVNFLVRAQVPELCVFK